MTKWCTLKWTTQTPLTLEVGVLQAAQTKELLLTRQSELQGSNLELKFGFKDNVNIKSDSGD